MEFLEDLGLPDAGESVLTDEELGELLDTGSVTITDTRSKWVVYLTVQPGE